MNSEKQGAAWLRGAQTRSARRRIAAVLRAAHRVVGLRRKRLALGFLTESGGNARWGAAVVAGGIAAMLASTMVLLPLPALANTISTNDTCNTSGTGTVGRISTGGTGNGAGGWGYPLAGGNGTYSLAAGCNAAVDVSVLGGTAYGGFATVTGKGGIAVGFNSQAGTWSLAAGLDTRATAAGSTAVGFGSQALSANSIAIGGAGGDGTTPLTDFSSTIANAAGSIAIGANARRGAQTGGTDSIAIGGQSTVASGATSGIAIGRAAAVSAAATNGIAQGDSAWAQSANDIAIGRSAATASGSTGSNIALGNSAVAGNNGAAGNAIAIGSGAQALGASTIAIGTGNMVWGANSGAIGDPTIITGTGSYSLGNNNTISANNAFVVGSNVTVASGLDGSVVLGNNSTIAAPSGTAFATGAAAPASQMSIGAAGAQRRLTNLAAGSAATDAVNVSQLSKIATNTANTTGGSYDVAGTYTAPTLSVGGTARTNLAAAVNAQDAIVQNQGSTTASTLGAGTTYDAATGAISGFSQPINGVSTAGAVGATSNQTTVGAALGALNTDVVNTANIAVKYDSAGGSTVTLGATGGAGAPPAGVKLTNLQAGTLSASSTDAVNGGQLFVTNSNVTTLTNNVANGTIGPVQQTTVANSLVLVEPGKTGGSPGAAQTLGNLAAGVQNASSLQAVNASQLFTTGRSVATVLGGGATYNPGVQVSVTGFSQPINGIDAVGTVNAPTSQTTVAGALTALNNNTANTANIAVKYDSATSPGQITLGATGGTLPAGQGTVKITNLTAGSAATDAVNVSQLQVVQTLGTAYRHVNSVRTGANSNDGSNSGATGQDAIAVGVGVRASGAGALAIGGLDINPSGPPSYFSANAAGDRSIALGVSATAGVGALDSVAIGSYSTASGAGTVYVGTGAGQGATGDNSIGIGASAGYNQSGLRNLSIGNDAGASSSGQRNTYIGSLNTGARVTGDFNTAIGSQALGSSAGSIGSNNTAVGMQAGLNINGDTNAVLGAFSGRSVTGSDNVAVGNNAGTSFKADRTVSIGRQARASADDAVAIGTGSIASASGAISIGNGNVVSGIGSAAIGDPNTVSGSGSYAIGNNNTIAQNNSFVLGNTVTTTQANSVVLGNASADRAATTVTGATIGGQTYTFAGAGSAANGVVSVGAVGAERQIINLAAGELSATSTDAINGSQLFATNTAVTNIANGATGPVQRTTTPNQLTLVAPTGSASTPGAAQTLSNLAAGAVSSTSTEAINGGQLFGVSQSMATHLGGGSTVNTDGTVSAPAYTIGTTTYSNVGSALTAINTTGIKYFHANSTLLDSTATGTNSVAIGPNAVASNAGDVALGSGSTTAAAVGTASTTINGTTYTFAGAAPSSTVSVGAAGVKRTITNVAAGRLSASSTDAINGSQLYATNQAVGALGTQVTNLGSSTATALGGGASSSATGTVSAPTYNVGGGSYSNVGDALTAVDGTASKGWNLQANGDAATQVKPGNTVQLVDGQNIKVTRNGADVTIATAPNLTADSLTINGGPVISSTGITNLAPGALNATSTDAVNGSQLFATNQNLAGQTTNLNYLGTTTASTLGGGATYDPATGKISAFSQPITNITSSGTIGTTVGQTTVAGALTALDANTTNLANNLTSGAIGPVQRTVTPNQLTLVAPGGTAAAPGAAQTLTNLAPGTLSASSTDAVNGSQLYAAGSSTAAALGGGATYNTTTGAVTAPIYTVGGATYSSVGDAFTAIDTGGIKYFHVKSTLADASAGGADSTAIGPRASAAGANAIALGNSAGAIMGDSLALGSAATVTNVGAVNDTSGAAGLRGIAIGTNAKTTMTSSIALGVGALVQNTAASTTLPASGIAIGTGAAAMGNRSIAIGSQAGSSTSNGFDNIVVGISSGQNIQGVLAANNGGVANTGSSNAAFGVNAGNNVTGGANAAFGPGAGNNVGPNTDSSQANCLFTPFYCYGGAGNGSNNVAFGNAAANNVSGALNVGVGFRAGASVNGFNNVGIGPLSGFTVTGSGNVGIGSFSGASVTGMKNAGIGNAAGGNVVGSSNTAIGDGAGSYVTGTANLAMGRGAGAGVSGTPVTVDRSIAAGSNAIAYGNDSLALGTGAIAGMAGQNIAIVDAIAIGNGSKATGDRSIAIGTANQVSGARSGAIGDPTIVTGTGSYSLGNNNTVNANNAFVVGNAVTVATGLDGSIVLGDGSTIAAPSGTAYATGAAAPASQMSIGAAGAERRITNLAAGAAATDAVNVSQLQAVQTLGDAYRHVNSVRTGANSNDGSNSGAVGQDAMAFGVGVRASGTGALAIGGMDNNPSGPASYISANAAGNRSIAMGVGATTGAVALNGIAIGSGSVANAPSAIYIGTGAGQSATGNDNSIGIGASAGNAQSGLTNLSVGVNAGASSSGQRNTYVGALNTAGKVTGDFNTAIGSQAMFSSVGSTGSSNTAVGMQAGQNINGDTNTVLGAFSGRSVTGSDNVAVGNNAGSGITASRTVSIGRQAMASAADAIAIGTNSTASLSNSVVLGNASTDRAATTVTGTTIGGQSYTFAGAGSAAKGVVSVGAVGTERQIVNLAAGQLSATSTDAVNGSQLFATNTAVTNIASGATGTVQRTPTANQLALVAPGGSGTAPGAAQTLTNVAPGSLSASSTDAVNGGQLFAANQSITTLGTSTANTLGDGAAYDSATGAISGFSQPINGVSTTGAVGTTTPKTTVAEALTALNTNAVNLANIAVKYDAAGSNTITLGATGGAGGPAGGVKIANLMAGAADSDAVNVGQLKAITPHYLSVNDGNQVRGNYDNKGATGVWGIAIGADAASIGAAGVAVGKDAAAQGSHTVAIGMSAGSGSSSPGSIANVAIGADAGRDVSGQVNTAVGYAAGTTVNGTGNVATGTSSGLSVTGDYNAAFGSQAGSIVVGSNNLAMGTNAGFTVSGNSNTASGANSGQNVSGDRNSAMGPFAGRFVTGSDNVAVGANAGSGITASRTVSIGRQAMASAADAVAIGTGSIASASGAISIGKGNIVSGIGSAAIGDPNTVSGAGSYAIGNDNTVAQNNSFVLGSNVTTTQANNVVLGNASTDRAATTVTGTTIGGQSYTFAGAGSAANGVVSVGAVGAERQIVNLAAGQLSATSTDAVNGSQLFATNTAVTNIASGATGTVQRTPTANELALVAPGGSGAAPGAAQTLTNVAPGALSATSTDAINGSQLFATNANVTTLTTNANNLGSTTASTLGGGATYDPATGKVAGFTQSITNVNPNGTIGTTIGQTTVTGALTALDANTTNLANNLTSGAIGPVQRTATPNQLTLVAPGGTAAAPGAAQALTNVAPGALNATSTDAVNGSQLFATNASVTTLTTNANNLGNTTASTLGGGATYDPATGKVAGFSQPINGISTTGAVGAAANQTTVGDALAALNANAVNLANVAVKYDAAGGNTITLGAIGGAGGPAGGVKITNLTAGTLSATSTDAVNGSQLYATNQTLTNITNGQVGAFGSNQDTTKVQPVASGNDALAGGFGASATGAKSSVVGNNATDNGVANSTVLGNGGSIAAGLTGSNVALGQGSTVVSNAVGTTNATIGGTTYNFAGATPAGTVSVGSVGAERTITNVAAGRLSAASTDAVNGSQLFATNSAVDQLNTQVTNINNGAAGPVQRTGTANQLALVAPGGTAAAPGAAQTLTNLATGTLSATSTDAVNGSQLHATNQTINNIQNGGGIKYFHANSTAADSQAVGAGSVAVGPQSVATGNNSVALGNGAAASNANDVALGAGSTTAAAVGTGSGTVNGTVYTYAGANPTSTVSVGSAGSERTVTNVAAGRVSAVSTDAVNGSQLFATNSAVNSLAASLGDGGQNAVRYDRDGTGQKTNTVTLQGGDPNAPVLIKNVATGVADSDAANVGQVKAVSSAATTAANTYTNIQVGAALQTAVTYTNQVAAQTLSQANSYTDMRFGQLSQQIGEVQKEARQAAAIGLAASSLRYDERPGKLSAAVGGGVWKGYAAGSMGLGYTSKDQNVRANVSATTTGDSWGIGAGLSFTLN